MLLAQLKHKVPSEFEGMEDILTASVIGLLKYLPDSMACELLAEFAEIPQPQGPLEVELWPRYATPPGFAGPSTASGAQEERAAIRGDTEPDAVIRAGRWLVLVEAKYRSPLDETYDQLAREFAVGYRLAQEEARQFRLLVITAHTLQPTPGGVGFRVGVDRALASASAGLGEAQAEEMRSSVPLSLHWTNWQALYRIFSRTREREHLVPSTHRLLRDVCDLLVLRGLRPYDIRAIENAINRWHNSVSPGQEWRYPVVYRYRTILTVASAWEKLLRLDTRSLRALAWELRTPVSTYDPVNRLGHFELGSLLTLAWYLWTPLSAYHLARRLAEFELSSLAAPAWQTLDHDMEVDNEHRR